MKKKIKLLLTVFIILLIGLKIDNVSAKITTVENICNVGSTDGLLYDNDWLFSVDLVMSDGKTEFINGSAVPAPPVGTYFRWKIQNNIYSLCPPEGCPEYTNYSATISSNDASLKNDLSDLFNNSVYVNLGEKVDAYYNNAELLNKIRSASCPKYIYTASNGTTKKLAYIFSDTKVPDAKTIFEQNGYNVFFKESGENREQLYERLYLEQVQEMKNKIQEFKDNNYGGKYNEKCNSFSYFGGFTLNENLTIQEYDKVKKDLASVNSKYDFTEGEKVKNEYLSMDCAADISGGQTGNETPLGKCEVVPPIIIKYLQSALKLLRWVALVLMIILGVLDFVKAAMADDQDALKKAWQHFIKRLIAVIILFLLPILIDFVLYIAGLAGFGCPDYNASNF